MTYEGCDDMLRTSFAFDVAVCLFGTIVTQIIHKKIIIKRLGKKHDILN